MLRQPITVRRDNDGSIVRETRIVWPTRRWSVMVPASYILWGALAATAHAQVAYRVLPMPAASVQTTSLQPRNVKDSVIPDSAQRVTLDVKDSTIAYVIYTLAHEAHRRLVFNNNDPLFAKRITVHIVNANVMDGLSIALRKTGLTASVAADGATIVVRRETENGHDGGTDRRASGGVLIGTVTDSTSGHGLGGAVVRIIGTMLAVTTSDSGGFRITDVPPGKHDVSIRLFGYRPAEQVVTMTDSERTVLHIRLAGVATVLSGVVTTATGVQSKLSVGSDITTINVDSVMKTAPIRSVTDLLENRVPGLTVVHTSGTPGAPSRLLLRGPSSMLEGNNPIVVVDGVRVYYPGNFQNVINQAGGRLTNDMSQPSPLDQIDPNTISTIEVLKGPSASALYGSDAANGVIVITTKKGQPDQTHWNVTANGGTSYLPGTYPVYPMYYGTAAFGTQKQIQCIAGQYPGNSDNYGLPCTIDSVYAFQALNDPRYSPLTHGTLSSASATVSGGSRTLTYSFTGSVANTEGMVMLPIYAQQYYQSEVGQAPPHWMVHPDDYRSASLNSGVTITLAPSATVVVNNNLSNSVQQTSSLGLSAFGNFAEAVIDTTQQIPLATDNQGNSILTGFTVRYLTHTLTSTTNATLNWRVTSWLPIMVTAGVNQNNATETDFQPAGLPYGLNDLTLGTGFNETGFFTLGQEQVSVATLNANTTIQIPLHRNEELRMALGTNLVQNSALFTSQSADSLPPGVSNPGAFDAGSQTSQHTATFGWFMEPQLQMGTRFFLTPGFRLDGGTASGSNAGYTVFPKMNASYIAIDQTSAPDGSDWGHVITLLRLRGSFGIAGVQPTPDQSLRLFTLPSAVSVDGGTTNTTAALVQTIGNTTLQPERSREVEAGFDAELLRNRLSMTATYYAKLRINAIESLPVATSVLGDRWYNPGWYSGTIPIQQYVNIGRVNNQGVEVTADAVVLQRPGVDWTLHGQVSRNTNVVEAVNKAQNFCTYPTPYLVQSCVVAGYPLYGIWEQPLVGFSDLNHDGLIEPNELQMGDSAIFLGAQDPRYMAGFGSTLAFWHGLVSLDISGDYQNGLTQVNKNAPNSLAATASAPGASLLQQAMYETSGWIYRVQTVNELRLNSFSATATLPSVVAHLVRGSQATVALQGSNLWLKTNYSGKDPNIGADNSNVNVIDDGQLPLPRTWTLAVRVTQ